MVGDLGCNLAHPLGNEGERGIQIESERVLPVHELVVDTPVGLPEQASELGRCQRVADERLDRNSALAEPWASPFDLLHDLERQRVADLVPLEQVVRQRGELVSVEDDPLRPDPEAR